MIPSLEEIEVSLSFEYDIRKHIIVPNVTMFFGHEIDLLVIRKTGYAVEIEIKRSVADMKAEGKKKHTHDSNKIAELYYAFPEEIADKCIPLVPDKAGIYVLRKKSYGFVRRKVYCVKSPVRNKTAVPLTSDEINLVCRYAVYRMWKYKKKIVKHKQEQAKSKPRRTRFSKAKNIIL